MTESEISIPTGTLTLQGTQTVGGPRPGPAALLISGSGPVDRDSNAKRLPINVMAQIATHLAAKGITSLRYDKRGAGRSGGDYLSAGFHDNVDDARAALDVLRARSEVDPDRVVVIGHSEGALIASVLASDEQLAGVALLAGAATNGKDVLRWQARQVAATLPRPVKWLMKLLRQDLVRAQMKRLARIESSTEDVIRIQFVKLNAKWFREFMAFEPAEALRRAAVPMLAITGTKDIQVNPDDVALMEHARRNALRRSSGRRRHPSPAGRAWGCLDPDLQEAGTRAARSTSHRTPHRLGDHPYPNQERSQQWPPITTKW